MQVRARGFTLIEILVAMTILFATVVTGVLAFQNNMQNSVKAAEVMHVLSQVDAARSSIRFTLQHGDETSGTDLYTQDVKIDWRAEQVAYLPPAQAVDGGFEGDDNFAPRCGDGTGQPIINRHVRRKIAVGQHRPLGQPGRAARVLQEQKIVLTDFGAFERQGRPLRQRIR